MSTAGIQRRGGGGGSGQNEFIYIHTVVATGGLILIGTASEVLRFGNN